MLQTITATRETVRTVKIPAHVWITIPAHVLITIPAYVSFRVAELTETLRENTHAGSLYFVRAYGPLITVAGNAHASRRGDFMWSSAAYVAADAPRRDTLADIPEGLLEFLVGRGGLLAAGTPIERLAEI
jgi:hypothetical protein